VDDKTIQELKDADTSLHDLMNAINNRLCKLEMDFYLANIEINAMKGVRIGHVLQSPR
jgi:hypothetical protein